MLPIVLQVGVRVGDRGGGRAPRVPGPADASNVAEALVSSETAQEARAIAHGLRGFGATQECGWRSERGVASVGSSGGPAGGLALRARLSGCCVALLVLMCGWVGQSVFNRRPDEESR